MKNRGLVFVGMGFELGAMILGGLHLGQILDRTYGWPGYGVSGMVIICMVGWFYHLIILLQRFINEPEEEEDDGGNKDKESH